MRVQPAESRWMIRGEDSVIVFSMVLVAPGEFPKLGIVGYEEAALSTRGKDLVLAKREGAKIAVCAYGAPVDQSAVGLGAIFDDPQLVLCSQFHDSRHVAWPSAQMDGNDAFRPGGYAGPNCFGGEVSAVWVDISKDGYRAKQQNAGRRSYKAAWRYDDLIARGQFERGKSRVD